MTFIVPMEGRTAPHPGLVQTLDVMLVRISDGAVLFNGTIITDSSGRIVISSLPAEPLTLWVKGDHTLASRMDVTPAPGVTLTLPVLREGDANDDNVVNINDFSILAAAFGTATGGAGFDARADFDENGVINLTDFSLLAANFGTAGPAMP